VQDLIKNVPAEKLREFIIAKAKYDNDFFNAVLLEFASNAGSTKGNKYSKIIQKALASIDLHQFGYGDDYYNSEGDEDIDILDQWFDKARDCVRLKQYDEAIQICEACIEEYSQWLHNIGEDASLQFSTEYQSIPFSVIEEAAEHANKKELFNYCLSEMKKEKYAGTDFDSCFQHLLGSLALTVDPDTFIALQDELLADIKDNDSYEMETILRRKIDFFRQLGKADKAWAIVKENIQIKSFRQMVVKNRIKKQKFAEAKKLINDFIAEHQNSRDNDTWHELLLEIAQKENDIPEIRRLAYGFIRDYFKEKYFLIYKAAFSLDEWPNEREKLFLHYGNSKYFSDSAAKLLAAEKDSGRLIDYVEKHLSLDHLEKFYKDFASAYPERTIGLFIKALNSYAEQNTGRTHYEYILTQLKKMSRIKGGKEAAKDLIADIRKQYKNRRAMMEILNRF
jgi:arsenate reductase-like glutaredoxin family protein